MTSWFLIQSKKSEGKVLSFECSHQQLFWRSGPFGLCLTQKQWYLSSHCYWREHKAKSLPFCHLEDLQSLSSHLGLFGHESPPCTASPTMKRTQEEYRTLYIVHLLRTALLRGCDYISDGSPQSFSITQLPEWKGWFLAPLYSTSVTVIYTRIKDIM